MCSDNQVIKQLASRIEQMGIVQSSHIETCLMKLSKTSLGDDIKHIENSTEEDHSIIYSDSYSKTEINNQPKDKIDAIDGDSFLEKPRKSTQEPETFTELVVVTPRHGFFKIWEGFRLSGFII